MKISLNIDKNKYNIPLNALFNVAARENTKRSFLFVSRVLGKHIPTNPKVMKIIGGILARLWLEENEGILCDETETLVKALAELQNAKDPLHFRFVNKALEVLLNPITLKEKTLFIGFAETATGIAQSVFSNFSNASYIHTTREKIDTLEPSFAFREEHSHAVNHTIYSLDPEFINGYEKIVLIDDELTTGNTAINLMKTLPSNSFGVITILDWRSKEQIEKFNSTKDLNIRICSLVKGTIECAEIISPFKGDNEVQIVDNNESIHLEILIKSTVITDGYSEFTGRFGITSDKNNGINEEIGKAAKMLTGRRVKGKCLCLGTEEFLYVPCMISAELGEDVYFHSTTRSPIYAKDEKDYCIKNKIKFTSPKDEGLKNYLYNIPHGFYEQVFLFTEKPLDDIKKNMFKNIFSSFNIKNIVFISFGDY